MTVNKKPRKGLGHVPPNTPDIFVAAAMDNVDEIKSALPYYGVNALDEGGMTPLHHASAYNARKAVEFLLAQPDIDPQIMDRFGRRAADVALEVLGHRVGQDMYCKLVPVCYPQRPDPEP